MSEKIDLILRVKAGIEAAALSDDLTQVHRLLGRVDDDVMRLHDLLCAEPSPPVQGLTEDNVAAILSTLFLTGARRAIDATEFGEACECSAPSTAEIMKQAEEHGIGILTASFLTDNRDPEAWRIATRSLLGSPPVAAGPWQCGACNHEHRGADLANICVGCACPHTAPQ